MGKWDDGSESRLESGKPPLLASRGVRKGTTGKRRETKRKEREKAGVLPKENLLIVTVQPRCVCVSLPYEGRGPQRHIGLSSLPSKPDSLPNPRAGRCREACFGKFRGLGPTGDGGASFHCVEHEARVPTRPTVNPSPLRCKGGSRRQQPLLWGQKGDCAALTLVGVQALRLGHSMPKRKNALVKAGKEQRSVCVEGRPRP